MSAAPEGLPSAAPQLAKILLIDDRPANLVALEAILEPLGQRLVLAGSGKEGLKRLLTEDFAVILLDVQMPELDGFETASLIRQRERSRLTPLIFLTANDWADEEIDRAYQLGAVDFLGKPLNTHIVRSKVSVFVDLFLRGEALKRNEAELRRQASERAALEEAKVQRARLYSLFMQAPALIAILRGPSHIFDFANAQYLALMGHRILVGKPIREALPELQGQPFFGLLDQVYESGEPFAASAVPVKLDRRGDGTLTEEFCNFIYQPTRNINTGQVDGILVHAVIVTEQVMAEKEQKRLVLSLARSNEELDQFAYTASHDLKAPLRGIANLSAWLEEDLGTAITEPAREKLSLIRGRVHRMEALIDGILNYSRIGRVRHPHRQVDVGQLLTEVIELLAPRKGVTIEVEPDLPVLITEPISLQQVFLNLIGNALKHGKSDAPRVRVGALDAGLFHEFIVADNGQGIAPEYHDKIWGIFQTLEARDKVEGTGIGLSMVRKIVELHGGRAWVESAPGDGAAFHFTWPKQEQEGR